MKLGRGWKKDEPAGKYQCPRCKALWFYWTKEQTGFDHDHLNLRSQSSCNFCEFGGLDDLDPIP